MIQPRRAVEVFSATIRAVCLFSLLGKICRLGADRLPMAPNNWAELDEYLRFLKMKVMKYKIEKNQNAL